MWVQKSNFDAFGRIGACFGVPRFNLMLGQDSGQLICFRTINWGLWTERLLIPSRVDPRDLLRFGAFDHDFRGVVSLVPNEVLQHVAHVRMLLVAELDDQPCVEVGQLVLRLRPEDVAWVEIPVDEVVIEDHLEYGASPILRESFRLRGTHLGSGLRVKG